MRKDDRNEASSRLDENGEWVEMAEDVACIPEVLVRLLGPVRSIHVSR